MFKDIFIELCVKKGVAPTSVCTAIGLSKAAYSLWTEESIPRKTTLFKLAEYFGVSVDYLLGKETAAPATPRNTTVPSPGAAAHQRASEPAAKRAIRVPVYDGISPHTLIEVATDFENPFSDLPVKIPVYGAVAAGIPFDAITDIEDYEEISADMAKCGEYAALRIHGDSMEPRMTEGDVVIVRVQSTIENGETAIVIVNGGESTCKKIKKTPEGILLISTNPKYEPMFYSNKQIEELPVRIFGKVVELRAKF